MSKLSIPILAILTLVAAIFIFTIINDGRGYEDGDIYSPNFDMCFIEAGPDVSDAEVIAQAEICLAERSAE